MNEVEKMYENAGIVPDCEHGECGLDYCPNNYGCGYAFYPPFTAEKQLELIKWLAKTGDVCRIDATVKNKWFVENEVRSSKCFTKFEEALANVINIIWEYMPDAERTQIKNILESEVRE